MSKPIIEERLFKDGGMDSDTSLDSVLQPDYIDAFNFQTTGNVEEEEGFGTNIASTVEVLGYTLPAGLNKCIGAEKFEDVRKTYFFIYNSFGYHQIGEFDPDNNTKLLLFMNLVDSGGIDILPLTSDNYVSDIKLVNGNKLTFTDGNIEIGDISIPRLKNGGYGVLTADDFKLIKAQPIKIPTLVYNDDAGRVINLLKENLFQARNIFIYLDYEPSAWSSISKRPVPVKESTTSVGEDVTKNNNLIVTVDIGTPRVLEIDIAMRYSIYDWFIAKSVLRSYVLSLPNTQINISQEIYEAYDPANNTYSFVFYNDESYVNIDPVETDLDQDYVPRKAETLELVNGNIIAVAGITEGYERPIVNASISVTNYNPNLQIPNQPTDKLRYGNSRSEGQKASHSRRLWVNFYGVAKTGDSIHIITADIRDANARRFYDYTVEAAYNNNTFGALQKMATLMSGVAVTAYVEGDHYVLSWVDFPYYDVQTVYVNLASVGSGQFSSIHALKSNSAYQAAIQFYDRFGRKFPLITGKDFIFKTDSYAQSKGLTPQLSWNLTGTPPVDAVSYQWLLSENTTHQNTLFINGRYVRVDGDYMVININTLRVFNERNASSVLNYQYSPGDRVTFLYYVDGGTKNWFDTPYIDVQVVGFNIVTDTGVTPNVTNYELKVRLNPSIDIAKITGKTLYIEIYTPKKRVIITGDTTTYLTNLFYEVGEQFNIINGAYEKTLGVITDGDVYFKTRDLVTPNDASTYSTYLAEDFNFSDLYASKYTSYGRGFQYNERDGVKIRKASWRYSDVYVIDSKVNMLNRFYEERLYGEGPGETSSSHGWVRKIRQRGNYIVCIQEIIVSHVPVYSTIVEEQAGQTQSFLSDKLFNKARYSEVGTYGMGNSSECYCESPNGTIYFQDPNNSIPLREGYDGLTDISRKMSKFFRKTIHEFKRLGRNTISYWNEYTKEMVRSTQVLSDGVIQVPIVPGSFIYEDDYTIDPSTIGIVTSPTKGVVVYTGGQWVYTPNNDQIGNDSFIFSFVVNGVTINKKQCILITPGSQDIYPFTFIDLTDQPLSTVVYSNIILIDGNDISVPFSITGGEVSINGGAFSAGSGIVQNGDQVQVRQTTSGAGNTTTSATLTIGTYSDSFDAKTLVIFYNVAKTQNFNKEGCPVDSTGSTVPYTVNAGTYTSIISQADADAQAQADIDANGQNYANTNGVCNLNPAVTINYKSTMGSNPLTWIGLLFYKNGTEVARITYDTVTSQVLSTVFRIGDTITIQQFHFYTTFPWAPTSKANLKVLRNNSISLYDADNTDPNIVGLNSLNYTLLTGDTSLDITGLGSSTASGYLTRSLVSTNNCNNVDDLSIELDDNTGSNIILNINPELSGGISNSYPFNFVNDAALITMRIKNNSSTILNYSITGEFSFGTSGTVAVGGTAVITNVPKGQITSITNN